jgi:hypothetical protein
MASGPKCNDVAANLQWQRQRSVAMLSSSNTSNALSIVHGCAASHAPSIDSATAAQQLQCRANILAAMHGTRVVHGLSSNRLFIPLAFAEMSRNWLNGDASLDSSELDFDPIRLNRIKV